MPEFLPFRGLRYDTEALGADLDAVAAPPYDVIDDAERELLEARHPANSVRLILPRDEKTDGDRYEQAATRLSEWIGDGTLVVDEPARFYGYRMSFTDSDGAPRTTLGVLGALGLPAGGPGTGDILPHEKTMPKAKSDRLALLRATRANTDPIWLLSLAPGLSALISTDEPLGSCVDDDGVTHECFAIDDPTAIDAITSLVEGSPAVLADGHHRFETGCNYLAELTETGKAANGAGSIMALMVELTEEQLQIEPIHRAIRVPGQPDIRSLLGAEFDFVDESADDPQSVATLVRVAREQGGIVLVDSAGAVRLVARPAALETVRAAWPATVASTDSAVIETVVVPRLDNAQWEYRHDAAATAALVRDGSADAAFLLRPVSVATTREASVQGHRMPQKTTFFAPKPRTGMVFRSLDF